MAQAVTDWRHTDRRRRRFLKMLAQSYDVEAALTHAKLSWPDICELRVQYPAFALRIEEVIAAGYDRVEAMLLREAGLAGDGKVNPALAQALLKQRRGTKAEGGGGGAKRGAPRGARSEAIKSIMSEFDLLRAGQAAGRQSDGKGRGTRRDGGRPADLG